MTDPVPTDEAAFQAALDRTPGDHVTRAALADWLMDRDDPRGPGYAALARWRRAPERLDHSSHPDTWCYTWNRDDVWWGCVLSPDYSVAIGAPGRTGPRFFYARDQTASCLPETWVTLAFAGLVQSRQPLPLRTRRAREDLAALVYPQLPQAFRNRLETETPA